MRWNNVADGVKGEDYLDKIEKAFVKKLLEVGIEDIEEIIDSVAKAAYTAGYEQAVEDGKDDD